MKKTVQKYTKEQLVTNYIAAIWMLRLLVITNIVTLYKWLG